MEKVNVGRVFRNFVHQLESGKEDCSEGGKITDPNSRKPDPRQAYLSDRDALESGGCYFKVTSSPQVF